MENKIGKAVYGLSDRTVFGLRVISGIITGVTYSEDSSPQYQISFGSNKTWVSNIAENVEELVDLFKLPDLTRVKETHNLKLKYD